MPTSPPFPAPFGSLRVARLGSATLRRLTRAPEEAGHVHSVFDRAINVLWSDGRLLTLHGPAPLAAPFAVSLANLPPRGLLVSGLSIRRADFDLSTAEGVALGMPLGPLAFAADALPDPPGARALHSGVGLSARQALERSMAAGDRVAFARAARDLTGLGEGLTPAGDDCVLGALAAIHRLAPEWLSSDPSLPHRLADAARSRTTDVARDFLLEALDGRFAEAVRALLTAPSPGLAEQAARELLAMGATSGADTLCGIRLACRALKTRVVSR